MSAPSKSSSVKRVAQEIFPRLGLKANNAGTFAGEWCGSGEVIAKISPIDGALLGRVSMPTKAELDRAIGAAQRAFLSWRDVPAPKRGELIRSFGEALRQSKRDLGRLVTLETGKILAEGEGEVQEMIDICDFAVGLSRQLHGPYDCERAPSASHDGAMASARCGRNYFGVQFSRRGLVVEQRARGGVW